MDDPQAEPQAAPHADPIADPIPDPTPDPDADPRSDPNAGPEADSRQAPPRAAAGAFAADQFASSIDRLKAIMARLRDPEAGCPWDVAQDFVSIAPYTIEEAYEVAEACLADDLPALRDELGDLLLQIVFHARMAEEQGAFALDDVAAAICDKMIRRHPHVFGDAPRAAGPGQWEAIKAVERAARPDDGSALAGVATALPALMRAEKLQKRAARTGFDWPDPAGARDKIVEELAEVDAAIDDAERAEEIGDLLFSVVNWARQFGVDPEVALRAANAKFERRFRTMEKIAGDGFAALPLAAKEQLWQAAKRQ